jgi:HK97 gp10 family phage protein
MASIDLSGMDAIFSKLESMSTKVANEVTKNALTKAAEFEAVEMEKEAPRSNENDEHMADSIEVSNIKTKKGIKYIEVAPNKKYFYYTFVNLGTSKMPANPFMARSFAKNKAKIREIIEEELKKGLGL